MAVHKTITKPGIFFITFTCFRWLPLIELTNGYDLVYKWFHVLGGKGHTVNAYVIMPNHLHLLLYYDGGKQSLNTIVGNGKRFMAYGIVDKLSLQKQNRLLTELGYAVKDKDRSRNKKHEIWKDSFDVKECRTEKFIIQKLHYIHMNPLSGKWKLCESSLAYEHSSALFYFNGRHKLFEVKDYRDFVNWEQMYD